VQNCPLVAANWGNIRFRHNNPSGLYRVAYIENELLESGQMPVKRTFVCGNQETGIAVIRKRIGRCICNLVTCITCIGPILFFQKPYTVSNECKRPRLWPHFMTDSRSGPILLLATRKKVPVSLLQQYHHNHKVGCRQCIAFDSLVYRKHLHNWHLVRQEKMCFRIIVALNNVFRKVFLT